MKKILIISLILLMVPVFIALCCQGGTYYAGGITDYYSFAQQFFANCPGGSHIYIYMIDTGVTYTLAQPMM
jgi:hypothetical protein